MKFAIIGIQNLKHMTTVSVYTDVFDKYNMYYDMIYIDKYGIEEKSNANNVYVYKADSKRMQSKTGKLLEAVRFRNYAIKIIEREKYDFLILWREHTVSLFSSYVSRKYSNRYSVNIRDLWNSRNCVFTLLIKHAIKSSLFNTVCSDGFIPFLPKADYLFLHCINYEAIKRMVLVPTEKKVNSVLTLSFIGTVRFANYCCKVVEAFGNDERFILKFIGQGSEIIKNYASERGFTNVECVGAFEPELTAELLEGTDIINCAYGAMSEAERSLLPTRFYYAVHMGIPIICSKGTWLERVANEKKIGITIPAEIDKVDGISDDVYESYMKMDFSMMRNECKKYIDEIDCAFEQFKNILITLDK